MGNNDDDKTSIGGIGGGILLIIAGIGLREVDQINRSIEIILISFGISFLLFGISSHLSRVKWMTASRVCLVIAVILLILGIALSCNAVKQ